MDGHTPDERQERSRRIADAIASGRLEGQEHAPEFLADAKDYIEGRIDGNELVNRARRRWGLPCR